MSSELTFRDRFMAVVGKQPHAWGRKHGLEKSFIANCLRGTSRPQQKNLDRLVEASGISEDWWLHGGLPPPAPQWPEKPAPDRGPRIEQQITDYIAIPLYNGVSAAAGAGSIIDHERPDDMLMFKEAWVRVELGARPQDLYLIRVSGDSMEPTLRAGDAILVNRRATLPDREGVYILRLNGMLVVKRLQALPGGRIRVISDNAAFTSFDVTRSELEGDDMAVIGRVVWVGRRM